MIILKIVNIQRDHIAIKTSCTNSVNDRRKNANVKSTIRVFSTTG